MRAATRTRLLRTVDTRRTKAADKHGNGDHRDRSERDGDVLKKSTVEHAENSRKRNAFSALRQGVPQKITHSGEKADIRRQCGSADESAVSMVNLVFSTLTLVGFAPQTEAARLVRSVFAPI